jgi:hypothetical protein
MAVGIASFLVKAKARIVLLQKRKQAILYIGDGIYTCRTQENLKYMINC